MTPLSLEIHYYKFLDPGTKAQSKSLGWVFKFKGMNEARILNKEGKLELITSVEKESVYQFHGGPKDKEEITKEEFDSLDTTGESIKMISLRDRALKHISYLKSTYNL